MSMQETMKIGIVCYPSIGGSGVVATELGKSLSRRGHQVHFFSYDLPQKLGEATEAFHFHHVDVPFYPLFRFPPYTLALATAIYEVSKEVELDILHVHYAVPHSTSAMLAKQMICSKSKKRLKVITTLHGTDTELVGQMPSYKPVVEFSLNGSNAVTTVSHHLKRVTEDQFDIDREVEVIYNPIDTQFFQPAQAEDRPDAEEKIITHISNFRPVKRVIDVVKIFDLISAVMPARLVLLGDGPDRHAVEEWVTRLGLNDRVEFHGSRLQVLEALQKSDLLLCTSVNESFGLTVAEALACGVPAVASNVGGVPEVLTDGENGFLAPVGEIQQFAEKALQILTDPQLATRFREQGRERIKQKFDSQKITRQYEELYQRVIHSPDPECPSLAPSEQPFPAT